MARPAPESVRDIALLGTGTIGASWAAYFLARGFRVTAWDPAPGAAARLRAFVDAAWPVMARAGLADGADPARIRMAEEPAPAVEGAVFVQESAPEDAAIKRDLYRRIDPALAADAIVASSTSGLLIGALREGLRNGARFVVGHPFNPPHLVPLVEVVGGSGADPEAVAWAVAFYRAHGKRAIRVNRELPGHVANRLQAALQREAFHLLLSGAASAADIDAAIACGPGLRWAFMGPFLGLHLAGGEGGARRALEHFGPALEGWWADLGAPRLDRENVETLARAAQEAGAGRSLAQLAAVRDRKLCALSHALREDGMITKGIKQLVAEAEAEIETIPASEAIALMDDADVELVDIRDIRELWREGAVPGARHVPRGMIEFWIDPESPYHKEFFASGKKFVFFCAGGMRSALATQAAQNMGLAPVAHIGGGFGAWKDAGGPVEEKPRP